MVPAEPASAMRTNRLLTIASLVAATGCGAATTKNGAPKNNQAPIADAGGDQTQASTTQQIALDGSASSDPEGHALTYSWAIENAPSGSNAPLLNATSAHAILVPDKEGTYYVRLTVSDGYADSDPDIAQVAVTNSAPLADAGNDRSWRTNCGGVKLDATQSTDPNGDSMQYQWSFVTKPAGSNATILDPTAPVTTFLPDISGLYTVQLTVDDGHIQSPPVSFNVNVSGEAARTGNVLVVNNASPYDVLEYSSDGTYLGKFADGASMSATTSAWKNLYGLAQKADGTVLISASVSQRVFKFSPAGSFLGEWSTAYTGGNLALPQGLTELANGDVLVVSFQSLGVGRHAVQWFTGGGTFQADFKNNPNLNSPRNVIVTCDSNYLVSNSGHGSLDRYDPGHNFLGALSSGISTPTGLAQLKNGTLLVTRFQSSNVEKFDPVTGQDLGGFTGAGSGLSAPSGVTQLGDGTVFVTSTGNSRVKRYDANGNALGDVGSSPIASPIGVMQLR
jgi:hypothetical protein